MQLLNAKIKFAPEHNEIQFPGSFPVGTFIGISVKDETIEIGEKLIFIY